MLFGENGFDYICRCDDAGFKIEFCGACLKFLKFISMFLEDFSTKNSVLVQFVSKKEKKHGLHAE